MPVVVITGAPNAGKSTLINELVGRKVSIVTPKVQTTRFSVRAGLQHGSSRIVLVDTPGVFRPVSSLDRSMQYSVRESVRDADALLHLLDIRRWRRGSAEDRHVIRGLRTLVDIPVALVLNKLDLLKDKAQILPVAEELAGLYAYERIFMISARKGDGLGGMLDYLSGLASQVPREEESGQDERSLAAEITREKLMLRLHQEIPYLLEVIPGSWRLAEDGSVHIHQVIMLFEERHKPVVIGSGGKVLSAVGRASRVEISRILGCRVHLFLRVQVSGKRREQSLGSGGDR